MMGVPKHHLGHHGTTPKPKKDKKINGLEWAKKNTETENASRSCEEGI